MLGQGEQDGGKSREAESVRYAMGVESTGFVVWGWMGLGGEEKSRAAPRTLP